MAELFANLPVPSSPATAWATLAASVDASVTTFTLTTAWRSHSRALLDNEYVLVTAGFGTTSISVTRGIEGSTAASHALGANLFGVLTAGGLTAALGEYVTPAALLGVLDDYLTEAAAALAYVPLTRTVNGHALSANVSVSASDVGLGSVENAAASALYQPLFAVQDANTVYVGPVSGADALPTFRSLVAGDIPILPYLSSTLPGATTQILYNNAGAVAGDANLTWEAGVGLRAGGTYTTIAVDTATQALTTVINPSGTTAHLYNGFRSDIATDAGNAQTLSSSVQAADFSAIHHGSGLLHSINSLHAAAYYDGSGSVDYIYGLNFFGGSLGSGHVNTGQYGVYTILENNNGGNVAAAYAFATEFLNDGGGGTVATAYAFHCRDLAGIATHPYYFWADSRGVYRIREDNVADGSGNPQAIPSLYNPRFPKYVAGAVDFERSVEQWVGNVLQIGAEAGGTGTMRPVEIIGASLNTPATLTANGVAVATQTYVTAQGYLTSVNEAALSFTDLTTANATSLKHGLLPKLSGSSSDVLKGDGAWASAGGGGDALVANPLSQFASTTSLQLKGVISDETGSGALVFATSPTLVTPTVAKLANLTSNGFVKTGAGDGTLSVDTATYLTSTTGAIGITIDGGGVAITTGVKGFISVPKACTIIGVRVLSTDAAATAGSIVVDIWKNTYTNFPPTVSDTITASAKPTLSGANKSDDTTLTGWGTGKNIAAGDILGFKVDSATTVTRVLVELTTTTP